jgi:hypothetical protein
MLRRSALDVQVRSPTAMISVSANHETRIHVVPRWLLLGNSDPDIINGFR